MALPKPRDKFWVTDPPAVYDDSEDDADGVVLICVFSTRKKLRDFYAAQEDTGTAAKRDILSRRYQRLHRDCVMMQWNGIAIDPDPHTGSSRIIRFDGQEGVGAYEGPDINEVSLEDLETDGEEVGTLEEGVKKTKTPRKPKSSILTGLALYE